MLRILLCAGLCLLSVLSSSRAADYYVAPHGNNLNTGTRSLPWADLEAAKVLSPGDVLHVASGVYTNMLSWKPTTSGSPSNPITLRADGPVTNFFSMVFNVSNYVVSGFTQHGSSSQAWTRYGSGFYLDRLARNVTITNCTVKNATGSGVFFNSPGSGKPPTGSAQNCMVLNCVFDTLTNSTMVNVMGVGHLIKGNVFANGYSADALRLFGSNVVIQANLFTNIAALAGIGNHPDIMQTFGDNGMWMVDFVFERNRVVNCPIQLMQMVQTKVPNSTLWGITLRNNVFEDSNMQSSISIPNVKFYNNTFYRCSNTANLLTYSFNDPGAASLWRGEAYGGEVINNAFVECSGRYTTVKAGPAQGPLTTAGAGAAAGTGYARLASSSGVMTVYGTYSKLASTVTGGTIFIVGKGDLYPVAVTNFDDSTFSASVPIVDGQAGYSLAEQYGFVNSCSLGFRINTSTFPKGQISGAMLVYSPDPPPDLAADYNFACGASGAPVKSFSEPHGINGGDPQFVSARLSDFHPTGSSPLKGNGRSLPGVIVDFDGKPRANPPSIGAFEYSDSQAEPPVSPTGLRVVASP